MLPIGWVEARCLQDARNDSDRRAGQQGEGDPITRPGLDLAVAAAAVQSDVAIQRPVGQAADSDMLHAAVERRDQPGEQVMDGRRQRRLALADPLDHLTGGGVDWFQSQLPRPAPLLQHDHTVAGEGQAPHEGDVGVG